MLKTILLLVLVACATASLLGGFEDVAVEDEEVLVAANHATKKLSNRFASPYHSKLAKVLKAKRQVVAGANFKMDIIVGLTTCKKKEVEFEAAKDCDFQDSVSTYKKCTVLVYR
ncbi:L-cystatin, partial [Stegodyphus mimosarum]